MRAWPLLLLCVCFGVCGNLSLKWGMQGYVPKGSMPIPVQLVLRIVTSPILLGGLVLYGVSMLGWLRILSTEKISLAYPTFVSLTFLLVMVASAVVFKEQVRLNQAVGCVVIIAGIWLVTR